jgi:hypothetical protein
MAVFSLRLPDEVAARFDAVAAGQGGRSALIRRLVAAVVDGEVVSETVVVPKRSWPATRRIEAMFTADEFAAIEQAAADMELTRSAWLAVVARRRIHQQPKPTPRDLRELVNIREEIRRIGVNVNQIAQAANYAAKQPGIDFRPELRRIDAMRAQLAEWISAINKARLGDLSFWHTPS